MELSQYDLDGNLVWIRNLFSETLQLPLNEIENDKPLIEMGADSLLLASALAYLNDKFQIRIRMVQFFEELPTINALADYIKHSKQS